MNRSDESRQVKPGLRGEDASMARTRSAAHAGEDRAESEERSEEKETHGTTGRAGKTVEAEHVMGEHESPHAKGAEEVVDDASAKANRKENYEPERERAEKSAIKSRSVEHSNTFGSGEGGPAHGENTMGHGQREVVGKNTV